MRLINQITRGFLICTALLLSLSGCLKEDDNRNCVGCLTLRLSFTYHPYTGDLFQERAEHVDLFIYNSEGEFVQTKRVLQTECDNGNTVHLDLTYGEYKVAVWVNLNDDDYKRIYECHFDNAQLSLVCDGNNNIDKSPAHIYHGYTCVNLDRRQVTETVSLIKDTNDITVIIRDAGPEGSRADDDEDTVVIPEVPEFETIISAANGDYNFDNSKTARIRRLTYKPYETEFTGEYTYKFRTMRLFNDNDMRLTINHQDTRTLLDEDLVAQLMKDPRIETEAELDRYDEYTLIYEVDYGITGYIFSLVKVNDWDLKNTGGSI